MRFFRYSLAAAKGLIESSVFTLDRANRPGDETGLMILLSKNGTNLAGISRKSWYRDRVLKINTPIILLPVLLDLRHGGS